MKSRFFPAAMAMTAAAAAALAVAPPSSDPPRVRVGPNVFVSRDGDVPHVELMLAASPRTSKNLLGGAITFTKPDGGMACRAYSSRDGGMTWTTSIFPEQARWGGGDPQVAYTARGTALFVALTLNENDEGRGCASMHVWRSENGGERWESPTEIPCNPSWDHEQIVVDGTSGRFAGRVYIAALYGYPTYQVGVFRSDDDGKTWTGPVEAANGGGKIGINDVTPMVLSDGSLVVPYADFEYLPEKRPARGKSKSNLATVISTDGGVTFSPPRKAFAQEFELGEPGKTLGLAGFPKFAADAESSAFRDRIYAVWEDSRLGSYRVLTSFSTDRGKTWSPPRPVDGSVAASVHQFQPALATNKDGTVGVTWFDTRHSPDGTLYDEYFAASLDGAATFLPAVRVSSESSDPRGAGNRRQLSPSAWVYKDRIVLSFLSAGGWTAGGHYMGLAAARDGAFHAFWVDARAGTSQIYAARVHVDRPVAAAAGGPADPDLAPAAAKPSTAPRLSDPESLIGKVELLFDPTVYDPLKNEFAIPVRLRNVSRVAVHPPIRIECVGFGSGDPESEQDKEFWKGKQTTILNAGNGKTGEGAVFDFDGALGGADALEPGAQTNPVVVRLKLSDPFFAQNTRWNVTGRLAAGP